MSDIIYLINGKARPANSFLQKVFMKINSNSLLRKIPFTSGAFKKVYKLPTSTSFNEKFYCSAATLVLGENVGLADTFIIAYAPIYVGDNCTFSFKNTIITSTHDLKNFSTVIGKPVSIGNNVWVTSNVTILPGVTIGDNTIIGAGSVVTKDIPSGVFAAGNPCVVVRPIVFSK